MFHGLAVAGAVSDVVGEIACFTFFQRKKVPGIAKKVGGTRESPTRVIFWIRSSWRVDNLIVSGWVGLAEQTLFAVF